MSAYPRAQRGARREGVMAQISFNADDLADCRRAIGELKSIIWQNHGAAQVRRLFADAVLSKQTVRVHKNVELMASYIFHSERGLSTKQCAKLLAEQNKSLRDRRHGPSGTTSPETMEKQIRREKKKMAKDRDYREYAEWHANEMYWKAQQGAK
jgi:hypothetical protein